VLRPRRTGGEVLMRQIPSTTGFRPRPALLYLPPVMRDHQREPLHVLELLHGTPGQPADWFTEGGLRAIADAFAAQHHGVAPLIVLPDLNGAERADSECIRTAAGADVETYLTRDVITWVRTRYDSVVGQRPWWIAGLSEGGLCSAVLALRHPDLYTAFGDFSGLARPIVEGRTVAESDQQLYRGDPVTKREHDPQWLLAHRHYSDLRAFFECGTADKPVRRAQEALVVAAARAGLPVHAQQRPGKHSWTVWADSLRELLSWL
jgi:S-formylglutathione hydrolase FrmB